MWPDRVSNPGPLTYESGALPIALRGPAISELHRVIIHCTYILFIVIMKLQMIMLITENRFLLYFSKYILANTEEYIKHIMCQ